MKFRRGLSLIEVLTVLSVSTVLMGILVPAVSKVRRQARTLLGMANLRQVVLGVNLYANDNRGIYPDSVATLREPDGSWHWQDPRMMTACQPRTPRHHRSMSAYLRPYFPDPEILTCPSAPSRYAYLDQAWEQGDRWEHPDSGGEDGRQDDALLGSYNFLWSYLAYQGESQTVFRGARTIDGRRQSKLLVTDYFGFDHYSSPGSYSSCEYIKPPGITLGSAVSSDVWTVADSSRAISRFAHVKLKAGYVDGSVRTYRPVETTWIEVSLSPDGGEPYPLGLNVSPGEFYIPR